MLTSCDESDKIGFNMTVRHEQDISILFEDFQEHMSEFIGTKKTVFIDPIVLAKQEWLLEQQNVDSELTLVPTNLHEANKDIDSLQSILGVLETNGVGRLEDAVYAIGGGALLDVVSFAASIYRRGISVTKVPTTLLGIIDASVGIKTGINYLGQRNRVGSYHFDYNVVADPKLMVGLNSSLIRQGLGEIFKIAIIKSQTLFEQLLENKPNLENIGFYCEPLGREILRKSMELMLEELHNNPKETDLKRCVDFGHSFSPLVEMESLKQNSYRTLPHGYAVAYDCLLTAKISNLRQLLDNEPYEQILDLYLQFDFDLRNEIYKDHNLLWASFLEMTKHRGGSQNLPIPIGIGCFDFLQDVDFAEMKQALVGLQLDLAR